MARQTPKDVFPPEVSISLENFERLKAKWLRYRLMGSFDGAGNFKSSLSFLESEQLPKSHIDFFHEMDELYAIAQRIVAKEKKK